MEVTQLARGVPGWYQEVVGGCYELRRSQFGAKKGETHHRHVFESKLRLVIATKPLGAHNTTTELRNIKVKNTE